MCKDQYIINRIAGSAVTLFTHVYMLNAIGQATERVLPEHPELKTIIELGPRYATVWNILIQIGYTALAILCDVTTLLCIPSLVPEAVRRFRYNMFAGLLFPIGLGIPLTFWPVYLYDRRLIFPPSADLTITHTQNAMAHGGVLLYALYELSLLPKDSIKYGMKTFKYVILFNVTYLGAIFYTKYVDKGVWCYDLLTFTEGTPLFYFAISGPVATTVIGYFIQWYIKDTVWRRRQKVD